VGHQLQFGILLQFVPVTVGQVREWASHTDGRIKAMITTQAALVLG